MSSHRRDRAGQCLDVQGNRYSFQELVQSYNIRLIYHMNVAEIDRAFSMRFTLGSC